MEKGIIVVAVPDSCADCKFSEFHKCIVNSNSNWMYSAKNDKPRWCPIQSVPDKLGEPSDPYYEYDTGYCTGWDSCLEEILGDEVDEG